MEYCSHGYSPRQCAYECANSHMEYKSFTECVLDIIANTDCTYRVALLAANFVFHEHWSYNNSEGERGLVICRDFDNPHAERIELSHHFN